MDKDDIIRAWYLAMLEGSSDKVPNFDRVEAFKSSVISGWHVLVLNGNDIVSHKDMLVGKGKNIKKRDIDTIIEWKLQKKTDYLDSLPSFESKAIKKKWAEQLKTSIPYKIYKQKILDYVDGFMIDDIVKSRLVNKVRNQWSESSTKRNPNILIKAKYIEPLYHSLCSPVHGFENITPLIDDCTLDQLKKEFSLVGFSGELKFKAPHQYYLAILFHNYDLVECLYVSKPRLISFLQARFKVSNLRDWKKRSPGTEKENSYLRLFAKIKYDMGSLNRK